LGRAERKGVELQEDMFRRFGLKGGKKRKNARLNRGKRSLCGKGTLTTNKSGDRAFRESRSETETRVRRAPKGIGQKGLANCVKEKSQGKIKTGKLSL